jgi:hypothetical protein
VFRIGFTETNDNESERKGQIIIGDFLENFLAPIDFWDAEDYRQQWRGGAQRFVSGAASSCFLTRAVAPSRDNFLEWWQIYRVDARLIFQNRLVMFDQIDWSFDYDRLYDFVLPYSRLSSDNTVISEWAVELGWIESFLKSHVH